MRGNTLIAGVKRDNLQVEPWRFQRGRCGRCGFPKRRVYSPDIDKIWAGDLVDMSSHAKENKGVKYLLAVIDVFSKYGWLEPLNTKRGEEVAEALKKILNMRKPPKGVKLLVDEGREFYNKRVKDLIEIFNRK